MNSNINLIIMIVLGVITVANLVLLIINNLRVKKLKNMYDKTLAKFNSHENIKDEFKTLYDRLREIENVSKNTTEVVNNFANEMKNNIQKIGFVKYNAYDDTENKLSFAITLLDNNKSGILLNHVYSKHGANIYAKLVQEGVIKERISEEEAESLKLACEDKQFKERKITEFIKGKKKK